MGLCGAIGDFDAGGGAERDCGTRREEVCYFPDGRVCWGNDAGVLNRRRGVSYWWGRVGCLCADLVFRLGGMWGWENEKGGVGNEGGRGRTGAASGA